MQPTSVPTVKELARDPSRARGLSSTVIAALLAKCSADLAELSAAQSALSAALLDSKQAAPPEVDDWITVDEAAGVLHHNRRWLYRNAANLPFVRRVSRKSLLCSESGIKKWMAARRA